VARRGRALDTQDRRQPGTSGGGGSDATAGRGIAGYDDLVEVGRGGFGVVYRADQPDLARVDAIKVLTTSALDERARHRFDRERRVLGMLGAHPHIISVYQSGFSDDRPYIVMEYMPGGSLAARTETGGALSWPEVLDIGVKVAGALHNAHLAGVLHRDLKPDNILVSAYGEPVLADFGIAAVTGVNTSRTGNLMASVAYAAPEVLEGKRTTAAADVYSFGATLFALLAGHAPHWRATDESVIPVVTRILTERPPDLRARGVPGDVCDVVERALAKDPADRYASAEELGRALQAVQRAHDMSPTSLVFSLTALDQAGAITGGLPGLPAATTPTPTGSPLGPSWLDRIRAASPSWTPPPTTPPPAEVPELLQATPTPTPTEVPAPAPELDGPPRVRRRLPVVGAAAAAAVLGVAALIWSLAGSGDEGTSSTTLVSAVETGTTAPTGTTGPTATASAPTGSTAGPTATGAATVAVPDLSSQFASPDLVERSLVEAGFSPTRMPTVSATVPSGRVIGLDPAIGATVGRGASIKVLVSTGAAEAEVPKVDGLTADAAQQALEAKGFVVRRELVDSVFTPAGVALETNPAAGSTQLRGDTVLLRVSAGPPATESTTSPTTSRPGPTPSSTPSSSPPPPPPPPGPSIPNVVGLDPQTANARLQGQGFAASRGADVCSTTQDGLVVSQSPAPGPAEAGATVVVRVGSALLC
jgi:serine/threonine protein kinase/beta-lactam-binding protein with PASTA domain